MTSQITSNVSLRKLTWKSKWDFTPKYQGLTLERVFEIKPSSLWWLYCKYEKITFVDEIIDKLKEKFPLEPIQKPGIDPSQIDNHFGEKSYESKSYEELRKLISAKKMNGEKVSLSLMSTFRNKKSQRIMVNVNTSLNYSKRDLQGINHGKLPSII